MADFIREQQIWARRRQAAEHAAADLSGRGIWICPCEACKQARIDTDVALNGRFCARCNRPFRKRKGSLYCSTRCRVAAWEKRQKFRKDKAPLPLFEPNTVDIGTLVG